MDRKRTSGFGVAAIFAAISLPALSHAACGTRYVATTGSDAGNDCLASSSPCRTIKYAVSQACPGDTVSVAAGTYVESGQIVISSDVTIGGAGAGATTIQTDSDTGNSGDSRGWFLVNSGVTFNLQDVTLDGSGHKVWQAIRHKGTGTVTNCGFTNIQYEPSGPAYSGVAIAAFGTGPVHVSGSTFSNIGRVGILYFGSGVTGSVYDGNTYVGKGAGDWLDYGVEVGAGASATITNSEFSDNRGVASVDGSTSAGILVTTYYGAGTQAAITGNKIGNSTTGIYVGYDASDTSVVEAHWNSFAANDEAMHSTNPLVDAEGNWWADASGPTHASNSGGTGQLISDRIDYSPWLADGTDTSPATGFQRAIPTTYVANPNSPPGYTTGGIQDGVDFASNGDTLELRPGTYAESINIDSRSNLTLRGQNATGVIVQPTSLLCWNILSYGCSRKAGFRVVNAIGIALDSMTMDFDLVKANFVFAILYWDSTGEIANNTVKNLSVSDASGGYYEFGAYVRAPDYTDNSRAQVTVSGNTFENAGRVALLTHDYVHTTVSGNTFYKTLDDFGYAIEIGSRSTSDIAGNTIYGYDTPALSDGSNSAGIYIENAFTGTLFGGPGPHGDKPVTIANNEVYDSQWALYIGNEFNGYAGDVDIQVTAQGNNLHDNTDGAAVVTDEDATDGSSVTLVASGNSLQNNGDYGYYVYTQGDGNVTVNASGEWIEGHAQAGIFVDDTSPAVSVTCSRITANGTGIDSDSATVTANNNAITGNAVNGADGTGIASGTMNAEDNWWGCPEGPGNPGCDTVTANVDATPHATEPPPCVNCATDADCQDSNVCDGIETCNPATKLCESTPLNCDDGNMCTADSCDPVSGCINDPVPREGLPCTDGDACTEVDTCLSGVCVGTVSADADNDGYCDSQEQQAGCDANDPNVIPPKPIVHAGSTRMSFASGEILLTYAAPGAQRVNTLSDPACKTAGVCASGFCTAGKVGDSCAVDADCNQPPGTCRIIINYAAAPDLTMAEATLRKHRQPPVNMLSSFQAAPGCSRKVDMSLGTDYKRARLRLKGSGTIAGKLRKDADRLVFREQQ